MPLFLAACTKTGAVLESVTPAGPDPYYVAMYGAKPEEQFPLPATDIRKVEERFFRQQVDYHRSEPAGTIVIDTANRFLYLVQEGGKAMRYGIGVGKAGLEFEGTARVARKAQWPRWTPTQSMIAREPDRYAQYAGGMEPGLTNPLGPRALYLFQGNQDTLYRIHGTSEPWSIGLAVSSGCIRLFNQDIIDLYNRIPVDTVVVVLQNEPLMYPQRQVPEWVARQINPRQPAVQPASEAASLPQGQAGAAQPRRPAMDI
ncbi:MAG: L,D-transpeptidase [Neoaquamicrobium sediminum]|uniref:L,D-transpeptidase n=1 Tax=Neoaquamicrobium sediminum TaxID=1849104 RepID=UPI001FD01949|nr:L,D-transpeptidase [Mesorhizobium sediminum]